ncbi:MAG: CoA transferase, partial [Gammaproteobacteria bacterium]
MSMENNRAAVGPRVLDDVRVLDFTGIIAGAYCTRMLADLGAEVLKVEPPGGEMMRHIAPLRGDTSTVFSALNSGKRSLVLDLKAAAAVDICKLLVTRYDVVVENFSPGVMARLGLDYAALREENPALVMCSISGYGQSGPGSARPAY